MDIHRNMELEDKLINPMEIKRKFLGLDEEHKMFLQVFQRNGKPAHLIQIANLFEKMFNCSFGSIYDQQEKVFSRKPFNRTKALDFLRSLLAHKNKDEK